jgi:diketogulonate reductase-like aldo/keto reductase
METRPFGPERRAVAVIGEGTWQMESGSRLEAVRAIQGGLDAGVVHVDTAEMYGHGVVEQIVGEAIAGRRDEVFLVSKVLPSNASYAGTLRACEASLMRLRTDRLDVYLLHWRGRHPLEETFRAFERLERDGKIRAFGVSNFDVADLDETLGIVGERRIACNQVLYHLNDRSIEHAVIPWCERHGVSVVAYSPLGAGRFPSLSRGSGRVLAETAADHRVSPRAVALRFLARHPSVFAIPKAARVEHVLDNARAGDLMLSDTELARIDAAFPLDPRKKPLSML